MAKVLVIDESEANTCRVLAAVVRERFAYEHIANADEALQNLLEQPDSEGAQVVVVGLLPPGEQRRLLTTLQRNRPDLVNSTIVITGSADAASIVRETRVQHVLELPFAVDDLEDALLRCAALSESSMHRLQEVG